MRDDSRKREVHQEASLFYSQLVEIIELFQYYSKHGLCIPGACAVEFQHICMHCAAISESIPQENKKEHFNSALGHANRTLLDGYKEFIFSWKINERLNIHQQRDFSLCRIKELEEGFTRDYSNTIKRYRDLFNQITQQKFYRELVILKSQRVIGNGEYWKEVKKFLELELLLSSLVPDGKKDTGFIQRLIESFIFEKINDENTRTQYLKNTVYLQKINIVFLILKNSDIYQDMVNNAKSSGNEQRVVSTFKQTEKISKENPRNFKELCQQIDIIFPFIKTYFKLKYAD